MNAAPKQPIPTPHTRMLTKKAFPGNPYDGNTLALLGLRLARHLDLAKLEPKFSSWGVGF